MTLRFVLALKPISKIKGVKTMAQRGVNRVILASCYPDSVVGRFWSKVNIAQDNQCWLWSASVNKKGYGSFSPGRKLYSIAGTKIAHRFAFLFGKGSLVKDLLVCHSRDTPGCCNPDHLWQGTAAENSSDMVRKCRSPRGEKQGMTLLTNSDVKAIKHCLDCGRFEQKELADKFCVSQQTISRINTGKDWSHIL